MWLEILSISLALAMDAFAVALANGMRLRRWRWSTALSIALCFGLFQALMTLLGYRVGRFFAASIQQFDHWIALILLGGIGGHMLWEAWRTKLACETPQLDTFPWFLLAVQGLATSVDALAVGLSFSLLGFTPLTTIVSIGCVTACLSLLAVFLGQKIGCALERIALYLGGALLCLIGLRIFVMHLLQGI